MGKHTPIEPGTRFGKWTVGERGENSADKNARYWCRCECGHESLVQARELHYGGSTQCSKCRSAVGRAAMLEAAGIDSATGKCDDPGCTGNHGGSVRKVEYCPRAYQQQLIGQRARRQQRRDAGLCSWCGEPARGGSLCGECWMRSLQVSDAHRFRRAEARDAILQSSLDAEIHSGERRSI